MMHIMLLNLRFILFFIFLFIETFKKVLMRCFAITNIIIYCTTIIPNILKKIADYIELMVVKSWLI